MVLEGGGSARSASGAGAVSCGVTVAANACTLDALVGEQVRGAVVELRVPQRFSFSPIPRHARGERARARALSRGYLVRNGEPCVCRVWGAQCALRYTHHHHRKNAGATRDASRDLTRSRTRRPDSDVWRVFSSRASA